MLYKGEYLKEISFPLGGIGSGSIGLDGTGRLFDWEIFNRPDKGSRNAWSHIAIKATRNGKVSAKVLNGDYAQSYMGQYKHAYYVGYGYGPDNDAMGTFPHFKDQTFKGEFPIAELNFADEYFPGKVKMTAFNPFIPLDDKNSSIPGAFFEIEAENITDDEIEYQIAFSVKNPYKISINESYKDGGLSMVTMKNAGVDTDNPEYGDLTIATDNPDSICQTYWYRGEWRDGLVSFWNEFTSNKDITDRTYDTADTKNQGDTCTLVAKIIVKPHEKKSVRFVLTWNVPNYINYWTPNKDADGNDIPWKNYYAVLFENSKASAAYSLNNWDSLYERTNNFRNTLFSMSLDESVIDAITANISILKTPTVLRLEDGSFWGWEGLHEKHGSCEGTCQHVWNYAYALCFLFPQLERSIRDAELKYGTADDGRMIFRLPLPYGREQDWFRPCVDGQMGTVFKCYREWKISGDDNWLKSKWPTIKKILEFAWSPTNEDEWDRNKDGVLEGRQHHTLDMELFGPSSWLQSMYFTALKAASEMAEYLGDDEKAKEYSQIFESGYKWTKENLFNGEYFIQKIDLNDKEIVDHFDATERYWNPETSEIKYQIGEGSSIDQMLGQWHANLLGLGNVLDDEQIDTALNSMMKNNFKESMRNFTNPWRVFSINDEAGTVICDYPDGAKKPAIPVPYCEETMLGFEYAFAGLLISRGKTDDGVKVVRAIRDRFDGKKRNPWNEFECGSNYARSMASFALLPIFAGFEFDLPHNYIGFNPLVNKDNFKGFWSLGTGWGTFTMDKTSAKLSVSEGCITLSSFGLKCRDAIQGLIIDGKTVDFSMKDGIISFDKICIKDSLEVVL